MKLIVNKNIIENVFHELNIKYDIVEETAICDYDLIQTEEGNFYLDHKAGIRSSVLVVEISLNSTWKLEQFQNCIRYQRKIVRWENGMLTVVEPELFKAGDGPYGFAYFSRSDSAAFLPKFSAEEMKKYFRKDRQLGMCDVCLMISGKLQEPLSHTDIAEHEICNQFNANITKCIKEEYNNEFINKIERICLGPVALEIEEDVIEGEHYIQTGLMELVKHKNGLCVLEILVYNCYIGGNKLLNYYRADGLNYIYKGKKYSLNELLNLFSIKMYGERRSMVFAYGDIPERAIINALVNEEYPMGNIGGCFEEKVKHENIALYDTAKVYISPVTMIECCINLDEDTRFLLENRIAYQVIEIFFVELILFQDAAMDKVYADLVQEQEKQYLMEYSEYDVDRFEQISFDMSLAMKFGDYKQFIFPTTRESARRVAENFGLDHIFEKYEENKEILDAMLSANRRQMESRENRIKNRFLLIISGLAAVQALGEVMYAVYTDNKGAGVIYGSCLLVMLGGYGAYLLFMKIYRKLILKKKNKSEE